ncbi:hypothetical protein D3C79_739780 [compost metagenome]
MHQHVQPDCFLARDGILDLGLNARLVSCVVDATGPPLLAQQPDVGGLREGAYGGGGQQRQLEIRSLSLGPLRIGAQAVEVAVGEAGQTRLHRSLVHPAIGFSVDYGLAVSRNLVELTTIQLFAVQISRQQAQLVALLQGEGEPAAGLGVQLVLQGQVHRAVQQGAGRGDPEPLAELGFQCFERRRQLAEVGTPDVAAIDHTCGEDPLCRQVRDQRLQLLGGGHQIQVQAIHLQAGDDVALMGHRAEIGGEQQLAGAR